VSAIIEGVQYWIKVAGTGESAFTDERWRERRAPPTSAFRPRRGARPRSSWLASRVNREERLAANEARWREINEGSRAVSDPEPNSIFCECADRSCVYRVQIDIDDYVRIRQDDRRFIVRPGHELPEIEEVVERAEHWLVVEKPEDVAHIVER